MIFFFLPLIECWDHLSEGYIFFSLFEPVLLSFKIFSNSPLYGRFSAKGIEN